MAKQPTILFFARRFYPLIGGVEKHVMEVSKRLLKKGFKVIVLTEGNNSLSKTENVEGIKIVRLNPGGEEKLKKFRIWFELLLNIDLILKADIIHCHDVFFWYLPFRFLLPYKKVYTTFHGYEGNDLPTKNAIFMHKIAEKLSKGNACVGDYMKKWYGTMPTMVTYGGVNNPKNIPISKDIKNFKNILYIGRLEEEAGIMVYLKALKILKQKGFNFNLTVLGDGAQRQIAEKFALENKLEIDFKGFVKEVYEFLPSADLIFSSRYLGTLESFVFKKLVICVYNNEIKKDCFALSPFKDFLILEESAQNIALEVTNHYNNPKLAENKIINAFEWVKDQTWDKMTMQYISLWLLKVKFSPLS